MVRVRTGLGLGYVRLTAYYYYYSYYYYYCYYYSLVVLYDWK